MARYTSIRAGTAVDDFVIDESIGAGSMAVVYKAHRRSTDEPAAVKVLQRKLLTNDLMVRHFLNESKMLSLVEHPNIVRFLDRGRWEETHYYAMEYVDGPSLREEIKRGMGPHQAARLTRHICAALCCAHGIQMVHRDLKPANVLVTQHDEAKLMDFGLSRFMRDKSERGSPRHDAHRTIGTKAYMAPEQAMDPGCADALSDLYSMGVVAYEMLSGKRPAGAHPPPPSEVSRYADRRFDPVVMKLMSPRRDSRYQNALDVYEDLQALEAELDPEEHCPKCGAEVSTRVPSCRNCRADMSSLFTICDDCRKPARRTASECPNCGRALAKRTGS